MGRFAFHGGVYKVDLGENEGSEQSGERPCICISNDKNNTCSNIVQIIPLTSQNKNNLPIHYLLYKSQYRFLDSDSTVLVEQLTTKTITKIKSFLGRIEEKDMQEIKRCIELQFNL